MNTKMIVYIVAAALLSTASFVEAQQPTKIPRIGYVFESAALAATGGTVLWRSVGECTRTVR